MCVRGAVANTFGRLPSLGNMPIDKISPQDIKRSAAENLFSRPLSLGS